MNMNDNPTIEELRELIRGCDDRSGHHVLFVKKNGDVVLSRIPNVQPPLKFEKTEPDMQILYETLQIAHDFVGPEAADFDEWILELFENLTNKWPEAKGKPEVVRVTIDEVAERRGLVDAYHSNV